MTVRLGTIDDKRLGVLVLQLLRATPNPPRHELDDILALFAEWTVYVDDLAPAVCGMILTPQDPERNLENWIDIPWWTWRGSGSMEAKLEPVFKACLEAVIIRGGRPVLGWRIGGQVSGAGADEDARRTDADLRADAVVSFMNQGQPAGTVKRTRAANGVDSFMHSTVQEMAKRVGIDAAAFLRV